MFSLRNRFLQFIEGPEVPVRDLMSRIVEDERHTNIKILFNELIPDRGFASWNMDHFKLESGQSVIEGSLTLIQSACRRNFKTQTETLVDIFKGFMESGV